LTRFGVDLEAQSRHEKLMTRIARLESQAQTARKVFVLDARTSMSHCASGPQRPCLPASIGHPSPWMSLDQSCSMSQPRCDTAPTRWCLSVIEPEVNNDDVAGTKPRRWLNGFAICSDVQRGPSGSPPCLPVERAAWLARRLSAMPNFRASTRALVCSTRPAA